MGASQRDNGIFGNTLDKFIKWDPSQDDKGIRISVDLDLSKSSPERSSYTVKTLNDPND